MVVRDGKIESSAALDKHGTVYIGSDDHDLYAIDRDGIEKWVFTAGDLVFSSPAVGADGTIYVGSNDRGLCAIAPDGAKNRPSPPATWFCHRRRSAPMKRSTWARTITTCTQSTDGSLERSGLILAAANGARVPSGPLTLRTRASSAAIDLDLPLHPLFTIEPDPSDRTLLITVNPDHAAREKIRSVVQRCPLLARRLSRPDVTSSVKRRYGSSIQTIVSRSLRFSSWLTAHSEAFMAQP